MTTLPPPGMKPFPDDSIEKQVYKIVEDLDEFVPIMNDRNRLGFNLYKFLKGEGDKPEIIIKNAKLNITGISEQELVNKLNAELAKVHK